MRCLLAVILLFTCVSDASAHPAPDHAPGSRAAAGAGLGARFAAAEATPGLEERDAGPTVAGPATLLGSGGRQLRLRVRAPLEPSAIDPVRRGRAFCLKYGGSGEVCQPVSAESRLGSIAYKVSCPSGSAVLVGLLPPGTAGARALLTDDRTIAVATREIPEALGLGPRRAVLVDLRPSEGIRTLELVGGAVAQLPLHHGPGAVGCRRRSGGAPDQAFDDSPPRLADVLGPQASAATVGGAQLAATRAGTGGLDAADDPSGQLCLLLRTTSGPQGRCEVLDRDPVSASAVIADDTSGTLVGFAAGEGAARVSITFSDRRTDAVDLVAPVSYAGRYAAKARFGVLRTPTIGADIVAIRVLRADGRTLADVALNRPLDAPRRLTGLPGGTAAWYQRARDQVDTSSFFDFSCFSIRATRPPDAAECLTLGTFRTSVPDAAAQVGCGPEGTVALGEVPRSTQRIVAVLVGGRRIAGRLFSLARRQTRAFVARAPRGQTLRAVELRFRSGTRRYLGTGLTGRSAQCGFDVDLSAPYAGGA